MTKKSDSAAHSDADIARVFDQTNGVLGDEVHREPNHRATGSGDVPAATNMLFGGQ